MTSVSTQKPNASMATTSRTNRFSNLAMGNGSRDEKSAQSSSFSTSSTTGWGQGNIWATNAIGSFNSKRDPSTNKAVTDEQFPSGLSGSGALAAASEADPTWLNRNTPWNVSDSSQTRPASGNTSPNRTRAPNDQSLTDMSGTPFFNPARTNLVQQSPFGTQAKPSGTLADMASMRYPSTFDDRQNGSSQFGSIGGGPSYSMDMRTSRDSYLGAVGAPSRDSSIPPSRQSDVDSHQANKFGETTLNSFNYSSLGQRPSLPTHSSSFTTQNNTRAYTSNSHLTDEDLPSHFARSATLQEPLEQMTNNLSYPAMTTPFQFNPGSQPWSSDPKSLINAQYRSTMSPKAYISTPASATDAWSRPSSRDARMTQDLERSRAGQLPGYITHQPAFYTPYYPAGFQCNVHPFDPYSTHGTATYRSGLPLPYGITVAPYITGATQTTAALGVHNVRSKEQDTSPGVRSMLLEEFRAGSKSNKKYELKDIYNHVVEFSGDQHGSRFIQAKLESANSDEKDQVFREIEPNAIQLMKDVFGNYVIQKFFEHGNQVQKKILANVMKGKMVDLSCQMYSCRVVQKALEHILVEQQAELITELQSDVVRIIKDQNGNHVIQKVIEVVPRQYTNFIMDALRGSISQMASHSYGCRVVQRLMEHGSEVDKTTIMNEIHACAHFLITDQYGNYVTQHVLQQGKPEDRHKIIDIVLPQLLTLSKHKFASNVVEKCIEFGSDQDRHQILEQMYSKSGSDGISNLQLLVKDQYGNYVIQKFLNELRGAERARFVDELKPCVLAMKKVSTGRTVTALDKLVQLAAQTPGKTASTISEAPTPASSLDLDSQSAVQTPGLTGEPNTPQSSDIPSTTMSAVGDVTAGGSKCNGDGVTAGTEVQVNDS